MARKKQKTLTLFPEVFTVTKKLTDEQFGRLMRAAYEYRTTGEEYDGDDLAVSMAFGFLASQIDRFLDACEANAENVKKRWDKDTKSNSVSDSDTESYEIIRNTTEGIRNDTECIRKDTEGIRNDTPILSSPIESNILSSPNSKPTAVDNIGAPAAETKVPTPSVEDKREKRIRFLETKLKLYKSGALADQEDYRQTLAEWKQLKGAG